MTPRPRTLAAALGVAALALTTACAAETPPAGPTPSATDQAATTAASPSAPGSASASTSGPGSASPTAGGTASASPGDPSASPTGSSSPSGSPSAAGAGALLSAAQTALGAVQGGRVSSIESERGGQAWEVHVLTEDGEERQLRLSGDGAEITSDTSENTDADDRTENQVLYGAEVDHAAAAAAVLAAVPGGVISELTLDEDDDDALTWEASVSAGAERRDVTVDAASGEVVDNDLDD